MKLQISDLLLKIILGREWAFVDNCLIAALLWLIVWRIICARFELPYCCRLAECKGLRYLEPLSVESGNVQIFHPKSWHSDHPSDLSGSKQYPNNVLQDDAKHVFAHQLVTDRTWIRSWNLRAMVDGPITIIASPLRVTDDVFCYPWAPSQSTAYDNEAQPPADADALCAP